MGIAPACKLGKCNWAHGNRSDLRLLSFDAKARTRYTLIIPTNW